MEQLTVCSTSGLINHRRFEINEYGSWNMLSASGFREEGGEGIVSKGLVRWHMTVRLDAMLKAVELPAGVSDLTTRLTDVDGDTFTLKSGENYQKK